MLDTTELLNRIKATVMVRQHQPLRRNNLASTASIEADYSIFEGGSIRIVQVILLHSQTSSDELWVLLGQLL